MLKQLGRKIEFTLRALCIMGLMAIPWVVISQSFHTDPLTTALRLTAWLILLVALCACAD